MSTSYAGPTATMYLADMGADVIKVERPRDGDDARAWGPPFVGEDSAWFLSANRNKRSVCIDLLSDDGTATLHRLIESADVFITNTNPSKLSGMGIHPDDLAVYNSSLIYCSISGFGMDGPEHSLPGYDLIAQARSGLMSLTGAEGGSPQRVSTPVSDVVAGLVAAFATAAALVRREKTGEGELIDVSLLESDLALVSPRITAFLAGESEPAPSGATDSVLAIYQAFDTADDPVALAVGNDRMWKRCCVVLGLGDLADDKELSDNTGRRSRRREIIDRISMEMRKEPSAVWLKRFARAGVPCQPVQRMSKVVADPQLKARGAMAEYRTAKDGVFTAVRAPWRLRSSDRGPSSPPPELGADTVSVLEEAGFDSAEIQRLLEKGAVWNGTMQSV
jgi:crotonobetainyl-CoA:carnitine CoA-transferase CaiB-like acyl-CoA transferase